MCNYQTKECEFIYIKSYWEILYILLEGNVLLIALNDEIKQKKFFFHNFQKNWSLWFTPEI